MDISEINPLLDPPVNREKYFTDNLLFGFLGVSKKHLQTLKQPPNYLFLTHSFWHYALSQFVCLQLCKRNGAQENLLGQKHLTEGQPHHP